MVNSRLFWGTAAAVAAVGLFATTPCGAQNNTANTLTPLDLRSALAAPDSGGNALAARVRGSFRAIGTGKKGVAIANPQDLSNGANPKIDEINVSWAIDAPGAKNPPQVVADDGSFQVPLVRVGSSDLYAKTVTLPDMTTFSYHYVVDGVKKGGGNVEVYQTPPERKVNPNVPHGVLTKMAPWKSQIFAGTTRDWWVYVPAQYRADKPAAVMVFQDGGGETGIVPTVFDNLIAKGEMPVTVGIFINPGTFEGGRSNRSVEYDTLSPKYSDFLMQEILPEVEKNTKLTHDPEMRAIAGVSSGGICAWTVAWEKPDEFRKVVTCVGSFVNLQPGPTGIGGGHNYPPLIRKTKGNPKPIRLFQLDGKNDLDNQFGNWPLANMEIDKALTFAGYDHKFVFGNGFHGGAFLHARIGDALRWIWSKPSTPTTASAGQ